jgi:hypothetical protein
MAQELIYDGPGSICENVKIFVNVCDAETVKRLKQETKEILDEIYNRIEV